MEKQRSYSLDLLKLVLAYVIAFFHCDLTLSPGPTVTVQVFFMISGFFLGKKFYTKHDAAYRAWDYTLDHVKGIYPHYFFSCAVFFLYVLARDLYSLIQSPSLALAGSIVRSFYNQIPDILLLQSSHFFHDSINYPLWQLSALLIAGYFIYGMLCHNEKLSRELLFPGAILMIQSLLWSGVDLWANWGPLYVPLLRAFSPMCIGVLTYYFSQTALYSALKRRKTAFSLLGILSLVTLFAYADYRNIFLMTTPVLILNCMEPDSWLGSAFNHPIFRGAGKLSYAIYLNHSLVIRILCARIIPALERMGYAVPDLLKGLLLVLILTVYSLFTLWLVPKLWKRNDKVQAI